MPTFASEKEQKAYDIRRVRAFKDLVRLEGWQMYIDLVNDLIGQKGGQLMEPLDNEPNAAARQEHVKGTMYGLSLARDIVSITITATQDESSEKGEKEREDA